MFTTKIFAIVTLISTIIYLRPLFGAEYNEIGRNYGFTVETRT